MTSYITLKQIGESRFEDRKSVFLGFAKPVTSEAQAIQFISEIKKRYPDARHWVYAYVLRENSTMRFTDDREPQGTAGMPILDLLRKKNITDAVVVVVRYFGGILLGTGGLVHAYTESALEAISDARIINYNLYSSYSINMSYGDYTKACSVFSEKEFAVSDTEYLDNVTVFGSIASSDAESFLFSIKEVTSGRAKINFIEEKFDFRE